MNTHDIVAIEDVGQAIAERRDLRKARAYRIAFAQENLDFRPVEVDDPLPLGRQILIAGGLNVDGDYSLFAILEGGDFEDMRLDETFDLRGRGAERFVAFKTDRDFKLTVNDAEVSWGKPAISGHALYQLAKPGKHEAVFLVVRGGDDREIAQSEALDLTVPGVEHFITAAKHPRTIEIVVNGHETVVDHSHQSFEQLVQLAYPGDPPAPNITYSITFRHVASAPHSGELGIGGSVDVKNGSIINVVRTIQS